MPDGRYQSVMNLKIKYRNPSDLCAFRAGGNQILQIDSGLMLLVCPSKGRRLARHLVMEGLS
jgi:hypothetical protein